MASRNTPEKYLLTMNRFLHVKFHIFSGNVYFNFQNVILVLEKCNCSIIGSLKEENQQNGIFAYFLNSHKCMIYFFEFTSL